MNLTEQSDDFQQLTKAIDWSIQQMETPRKKRVEAVKEYVGRHYADDGSEQRVPTNMLELAVTIYARMLAVRAPRVLVGTESPELKTMAKNMELALNQVPDEINLGNTLRRAVVEALFSVGILKVGLSKTDTIMGHEYGEPYVDLVTLDDYFCDMSAKNYEQIQFEGNDYWMPLEEVKRNPAFSDENELSGDDHTVIGEQGQERAESVSQDEGATTYKDRVWLRDVWLPESNQLVTYAVKQGKLLNVVNWDGPKEGPYRRLAFAEVPGNILPLPPVALWRDLHELGNALFRKLGRQADNHKRVLGFSGNDDEAVKRFRDAKDGDGIRWGGQRPETLEAGGIDQSTLAFFLQSRDLYSYFAGNLDSLGGLAPQAETLGQEEIMTNASNARLHDMRDAVYNLSRSVYKTLAWYEWTDPIRTRTITKKVPNTEIEMKTVWSPATREGRFIDYNFDIDVYSMQDNSPETQMQKLQMVTQNYVLPLLPLIQQQGGQVDLESFFDLIGKYANLPELSEYLRFVETPEQNPSEQVQGNPQPQTAGGGSAGGQQPAQTTRRYERVNKPGATRSGKDQVMSQLLMGGNAQSSEKESLFRSES